MSEWHRNFKATFRPIDVWPGESTGRRKGSPFSASWPSTLALLKRELRHLGARNIVVQLAITEDELRLDGYPRSSARPSHPGVIVAFESRYGPLKYATDRFTHWQDNIRAIALGLEALRKVDRYGITKRGEQYTGWKALPSGPGDLAARGRELVRRHGGVKAALLATHPDHGGHPDDFRAVQAARTTTPEPPEAS